MEKMIIPTKYVCGILFLLLLSTGCGRGDLPRAVVFGDVSCGGKKVDRGTVRFAPMEAASTLPSTTGIITDGQYRIDLGGGIPLGKYRVEVYAQQLTGKTVADRVGRMIEETVPLGPPIYAGGQSPLVAEVKADSDGRLDLAIP